MKLPPNTRVPDVSLTTLAGQSVLLARLLSERKNTLLVFLRHLG